MDKIATSKLALDDDKRDHDVRAQRNLERCKAIEAQRLRAGTLVRVRINPYTVILTTPERARDILAQQAMGTTETNKTPTIITSREGRKMRNKEIGCQIRDAIKAKYGSLANYSQRFVGIRYADRIFSNIAHYGIPLRKEMADAILEEFGIEYPNVK